MAGLYLEGIPIRLCEGMTLAQRGAEFIITRVNGDEGTIGFAPKSEPFSEVRFAVVCYLRGVTLPYVYCPAQDFTFLTYHKCACCGKVIEKSDVNWVGDDPFCEECFERDYRVCDDCGEAVFRGDGRFSPSESFLCESCFSRDYVYCHNCERVLHINDATHIDDEYFCDDCRDENYEECYGCHEYVHRDYARWINGQPYCDSCADNYVECAECGYVIHQDDSYYDEDEDRDLCCDCYRELHGESGRQGTVRQHWSKLKTKFHDDREGYSHDPLPDTMYYGMEIEMETYNDFDGVAEAICDKTEDDWYLEYDGSLSDGIETVIHARTFESWQNFWDDLDNRLLKPALERGCKGHSPGTCGIHIHTSLAAWTGDQLFRLFCLLYGNTAYQDILTISQRKEGRLNRWASLDINDLGHVKDGKNKINNRCAARIKDKRNPHGKRYAALNITDKTLEIRLFNSSLRIDRVRKNMEFVHALYLYTGKYASVSWNGFKLWVKRNKETVPFLYGFMNEKGLLSPAKLEEGDRLETPASVEELEDQYVGIAA